MNSDIGRQLEDVLLPSRKFHQAPEGTGICENEIGDAVEHYNWVSQAELSSQSEILAGFSPQFLEIAALGAKGYAAALTEMLPAKPDGLVAEASQRTQEVLTCVKERRKPTVSPWTGMLSYAYHSLGREWYLYEEDDRYCLISTAGETSFFAFRDMIWVFPQSETVIAFDNGHTKEWVKQEIKSELLLILSNKEKVADYVRREHKSVGVADFWCPHISHNLWNMLSGWDNVLTALPKGAIDRFFTFDGQALYGSIAELFPDKVRSETVSAFTKDSEIFKYILDENIFLASVKDEYISLSLTRRILELARSKCRPDFLDALKGFQNANKCIILITIRVGNRSWVGQEEGWPQLMIELFKTFDSVGFIIDGLSADASMGWTTSWLSLNEDQRLLESIRSALPADFPIFDGVGLLFSESVVLADACDFFIAPIGSGMALYKWISNKSGVAFSNSAVLDRTGTLFDSHREWDKNRPNIKEAVYLESDKVKDISSSHDAASRLNFTMDWQELYKLIVAAIQSEHLTAFNRKSTER